MGKFAMKIKWESGYITNGKYGVYLVTMERIKNTYYGTPRYKAKITVIRNETIGNETNDYRSVASVLWKSHYRSEAQEAEEIINEYEKEIFG